MTDTSTPSPSSDSASVEAAEAPEEAKTSETVASDQGIGYLMMSASAR